LDLRYRRPMPKRFVFAASLMLACGSKTDNPASTDTDPSLSELASLRDKMCACKDKGCADAVSSEMLAFFKRNRPQYDGTHPEKKPQWKKLDDEQYECWKKLR
jgi:hypothetical protein